jgi:hypothetical protein
MQSRHARSVFAGVSEAKAEPCCDVANRPAHCLSAAAAAIAASKGSSFLSPGSRRVREISASSGFVVSLLTGSPIKGREASVASPRRTEKSGSAYTPRAAIACFISARGGYGSWFGQSRRFGSAAGGPPMAFRAARGHRPRRQYRPRSGSGWPWSRDKIWIVLGNAPTCCGAWPCVRTKDEQSSSRRAGGRRPARVV